QDGVRESNSLADGLAGAVEPDSLTIPLVRRLVQDFILVSEDAITQAIAYAWHKHGQVIEGSGAAALAAALTGRVTERPAAVIITGGNIYPQLHREISNQWTGEELFG